jgi:hypothetical protein
MVGVQRSETSSTAGGRGWVIAAVLASSMICGVAGWAQSVPASTSAPAPRSVPATATGSAKPPAPAAPAKGPSEGITVLGHWVIEVHNPDGAVTARREFENAVQLTGENYMASLLAGNNSPGGLSIALNGRQMQFETVVDQAPGGSMLQPPLFVGIFPIFNTIGPCQALEFTTGIGQTYSPDSVFNGGTGCLITTGITGVPGNDRLSWLGFLCFQSRSCGRNLTVSAPSLPVPPDESLILITPPTSSAPVVLSGSVVVSATIAGSVYDVETLLTACDANSSAQECLNIWDLSLQSAVAKSGPTGWVVPDANLASVSVFTEKDFDSNGTDPAPIPYQPNQTIAVTVTISFQ